MGISLGMTRNHKEIRCSNDSGFTLIELMVVIGIIAVLAALALTILTSSRRMAQEITAKHDLKEFVQAQHAYHLQYGSYKGAAGDVVSGDPAVASTLALKTFEPSPQVVITLNSVDPLLTASGTHTNTKTVWLYRQDTGEITK